MIIAKTNLKKLPEKCSKCKFKYCDYDDICAITGKTLKMIFNKEKNNWEFAKPKWCPLEEQ